MGRVRNYLCSTMTEARSASLSLLYIEGGLSLSIDGFDAHVVAHYAIYAENGSRPAPAISLVSIN